MSEEKKTFETLKGLLVDLYDVDPKTISPDVAVVDLGLDSLALMEFIFAESPRELRRLHTLRRWSHEQEIKPFFTRGA